MSTEKLHTSAASEDVDNQRLKEKTTADMTDRGDFEDQISFFDLPWDDVIFTYILPGIPIQTLFHLRQVCTRFHQLIKEYFSVMKDINIARIAGKMNCRAFDLMTCNNSSLHTLNLRNAKAWLQDQSLISVLKTNSKLELIDLTCCNSLTNASMQVLAINCPKVKTLILRDCPWLATEGLTVVALHCNQLEKIDVTGCWNVTDNAITVMAQSCPRLKSVSLSKLYGLSDVSLIAIAKQCEHLQHLNIQGCWRITDDSVRFLAEYSKRLKMLQIRDCRYVTEVVLSKLREKGVKMDKLPPPGIDNHRRDFLNLRLRHRLPVQI